LFDLIPGDRDDIDLACPKHRHLRRRFRNEQDFEALEFRGIPPVARQSFIGVGVAELARNEPEGSASNRLLVQKWSAPRNRRPPSPSSIFCRKRSRSPADAPTGDGTNSWIFLWCRA